MCFSELDSFIHLSLMLSAAILSMKSKGPDYRIWSGSLSSGGRDDQGGRIWTRASRALGPNLSGNFTKNSSTMSPLFSGNLERGSPSPTILFFIPGLMTSRDVTVTVLPSRVGALMVQPHRAWREGEKTKRKKINFCLHSSLLLFWFTYNILAWNGK